MTLRVGILGAGGIGARHAAACAAVEGLELVACCGRDPARTETFAARFGIRDFFDFRQMLDSADLDLLIVALPPYAHSGEVEIAAAAGVNLLLEKPIALDVGRAESMVAASAGVAAACGFMYRFGAAVQRWDDVQSAGETGPVGFFAGSFHCNALHAPWWRDRARSGGQMVEQLIHIADLCRHTLGMPETVYARAANVFHRQVPGYTSEDVSAIVLGYPGDRLAVLQASNIAIPGRWMKGWRIEAERATGLFTDWNAAEITFTAGDVRTEQVAGTIDPFVAQLADLREAIVEKRPPRIPLRDGLSSLQLVLAARRSADERREIAL